MSYQTKKAFYVLILAVGLFSIPFIYNACEGQFEPHQSAHQVEDLASCSPASLISQKKQVEYKSPFEKNKLFGVSNSDFSRLSNKISVKEGIIKAGTKLAVLIDNQCVLPKRENQSSSLSVSLIQGKRISEEVKIQSYSFIPASDLSVEAFRNDLESDECIIGVGFNKVYNTSSVVDVFNDSKVFQQAHLSNLDSDLAYEHFYNDTWGIRKDRKSARIAVIDTGVWYRHYDLVKNMYHPLSSAEHWGIDAYSLSVEGTVANYNPGDVSNVSHGTHVAGLIGAEGNNAYGMVGVMPHGAELMGIKVFGNDLYDLNENSVRDEIIASTVDIVTGIYWAIENGAEVINLSLSRTVEGASEIQGGDPVYEAAIVSALRAGITVVVSAGNGSPDGVKLSEESFMTFPAYYGKKFNGVITVGSFDIQTGKRSSFSHFGTDFVEIAAPGSHLGTGGIYSTVANENNDVGALSGTSQSAPQVSGAVGLALALIKANYSGLKPSPPEVEELLKAGSVKDSNLTNDFKDGNRLNLKSLVDEIHKRYPATASDLIEKELPRCF